MNSEPNPTEPPSFRKLGAAERRTFLEDGDTVIFKGWCEAPGAVRIGFGAVRDTVQPALGAAVPL